jgi:transposase-like protein
MSLPRAEEVLRILSKLKGAGILGGHHTKPRILAPRANHKSIEAEGQAIIQELLQERLRLAIQYMLVTVLEEEVEIFFQAALYQRTPERKDYHNGFYERDLVTIMGVIEDLPIPRTRNSFRTQLFEGYQRGQAELDETISDVRGRREYGASGGDH